MSDGLRNTGLAVSPSILAADFMNLSAEIRDAELYGADYHHVDVMDGHFVPNLSLGLPVVEALKSVSKLPLDVHIMITNPDQMALNYVKAGADRLAFHVEAAVHPHRLAQSVRQAGAKVGIAINPGTSLTTLDSLLDEIDFVTIMSVNPGFSGQSFIQQSVERVRALRNALDERPSRSKVEIEVDGGVNESNAGLLAAAGANVVVVGNYFYRSKDRKGCIARIK